jgi:hypothetical protein
MRPADRRSNLRRGALGCALWAVACAKEVPVDVTVVGPGMADPFVGAMGATHVRVGFEGDPRSVRQVPVGAGARFDLDLRPTDPRGIHRLRVDVLREGALLAQGATPPVAWLNVGGQRLTAFVAPADEVALAPGGSMRTPRANFTLVSAGGRGAVAFTLPGGGADAPPDWYFLPSHRQQPYTFAVSGAFDGDTSVVPLPSDRGVLLIRGERALVSNDTSAGAPPLSGIPSERRVLRGAAVASDLDAGYLLGGFGDAIPRARRIDRVSELGDVTSEMSALATPRGRARVLRLQPRIGANPPSFLVFDGQDPACAECPSIERWSPGADGVGLGAASVGDSLARRADFALVCIAFDAEGRCDRLLALGGVDLATGALAARDVLLDGPCLRASGPSCVRAELSLLSSRRRGLRATLGVDGLRVVVTGGRDADGRPVYALDLIDASVPDAPTRRSEPREIPVHDPATLAMADGSVMLAGGLDRATQQPSATVWFIRGPLAPLALP